MKQDIAEYLIDSFIDFKGEKHDVVVCALSQTPCCESFVDSKFDPDYEIQVYRTLSLGIAICNPVDKFNEEKGKKIAYNKAANEEFSLVSTHSGVINTPLVRALLRQEMEHIKKYPGKFIKGYDDAQARYEASNKLDAEVQNLSNQEAEVVQAAMDGVDVLKCAKLARKLLDRKINELSKSV